MMDVQKTLEFADRLCEDARGDVGKMNRLAVSPGLKFYMNNVHLMRAVEKPTFVSCYPDLLEEIETIRLKAEKAAAAEEAHFNQSDRIAALEAKMDKLTEALTRFMAATEAATEDDEPATESEPEPEPEQPKRRRAKKAQADPEDQEDQDDPAGDAEAGEDEAE